MLPENVSIFRSKPVSIFRSAIAIIGAVDIPEFYEKAVGAIEIPESSPGILKTCLKIKKR